MKKIVLIFKEDKVEADAEGFQGKECIEKTDEILKKLNARVLERRKKREYYVGEETIQEVRD